LEVTDGFFLVNIARGYPSFLIYLINNASIERAAIVIAPETIHPK
jgi:hypothetical protein